MSSRLRRAVLGGRIGREVAALAHEELDDLRPTTFAFDLLATPIWALHPSVTAHDARYVGLAEMLDA